MQRGMLPTSPNFEKYVSPCTLTGVEVVTFEKSNKLSGVYGSTIKNRIEKIRYNNTQKHGIFFIINRYE